MEKKYEYRIIGRFRKDEKHHVVGGALGKFKTREDAELELKRLQGNSEWEMKNKRCKPNEMFQSKYYSEYDLLDLKIQKREISPWTDL